MVSKEWHIAIANLSVGQSVCPGFASLGTLIKVKGVISAFLGKLINIKQNISQREFSPFLNLSLVEHLDEDIQTHVQDTRSQAYEEPGEIKL